MNDHADNFYVGSKPEVDSQFVDTWPGAASWVSRVFLLFDETEHKLGIPTSSLTPKNKPNGCNEKCNFVELFS